MSLMQTLCASEHFICEKMLQNLFIGHACFGATMCPACAAFFPGYEGAYSICAFCCSYTCVMSCTQ